MHLRNSYLKFFFNYLCYRKNKYYFIVQLIVFVFIFLRSFEFNAFASYFFLWQRQQLNHQKMTCAAILKIGIIF